MRERYGWGEQEADRTSTGGEADFSPEPWDSVDLAEAGQTSSCGRPEIFRELPEAEADPKADGTGADFGGCTAAGVRTEEDPAVRRGRADFIGSAGGGNAAPGGRVSSSAANPTCPRMQG